MYNCASLILLRVVWFGLARRQHRSMFQYGNWHTSYYFNILYHRSTQIDNIRSCWRQCARFEPEHLVHPMMLMHIKNGTSMNKWDSPWVEKPLLLDQVDPPAWCQELMSWHHWPTNAEHWRQGQRSFHKRRTEFNASTRAFRAISFSKSTFNWVSLDCGAVESSDAGGSAGAGMESKSSSSCQVGRGKSHWVNRILNLRKL